MQRNIYIIRCVRAKDFQINCYVFSAKIHLHLMKLFEPDKMVYLGLLRLTTSRTQGHLICPAKLLALLYETGARCIYVFVYRLCDVNINTLITISGANALCFTRQ